MNARRRIAIGACVATLGCGPATADPMLSLPTCDRDGPVRLLDGLIPLSGATVGNDRLLVAGTPDHPALGPADADESGEVWTVGPCGEDPMHVASFPADLRLVGDALVECSDDGRVERVDTRNGSRTPLFDRAACRVLEISAGLVARDPTEGRLMLTPAGGGDAVVLADDIPGPDCVPGCDPADPRRDAGYDTIGDAIVAVDGSGRLLRAVRPDAVTVLATNAVDFEVVGQRVVVEHAAFDDQGNPIDGPLDSIDPATGATLALDFVGLASIRLVWPLAVGRLPSGEMGIRDIRSDDPVPLPGDGSIGIGSPQRGPHVIVQTSLPGDPSKDFMMWRDTGGWLDLGAFEACSAAEEHFGRVEVHAQTCDYPVDGALWIVPLDGGAPTLVLEDTSGMVAILRDHVAVSPLPKHDFASDVGELEITTLATGTREILDRRGFPILERESTDLGGDLLYAVVDGDRTGLWRSALP